MDLVDGIPGARETNQESVQLRDITKGRLFGARHVGRIGTV